jgi:hypothetical protein
MHKFNLAETIQHQMFGSPSKQQAKLIKYRDQSRHGFSIKVKRNHQIILKGNMQNDAMQPINKENKTRIARCYLS